MNFKNLEQIKKLGFTGFITINLSSVLNWPKKTIHTNELILHSLSAHYGVRCQLKNKKS